MDTLGVSDPQAVAEFHEGFTENEFVVVAGQGAHGRDQLVCALRTGTYVPADHLRESYRDLGTTVVLPDGTYLTTGEPTKPLYLALSEDSGTTWSRPQPIAPACGACPRMLLLSNGTLALSYGRLARPSQGNGIIFSRDGGATWTENTLISPNIPTGYTSMVEIGSDRILYAFDVASAWPWWEGPGYTAVAEIEVLAT